MRQKESKKTHTARLDHAVHELFFLGVFFAPYVNFYTFVPLVRLFAKKHG